MRLLAAWVPGLLSAAGLLGTIASDAQAALLVGNTRGNNIVAFDEISGQFLGEFISARSGLDSPDTFLYGPDGNLYVSSGTTPENSAIFRFNGTNGQFIDKFATGGSLFRPYGLAFGPDQNLYVSSFLSDEILRYDGTTGALIDVFAAGDGVSSEGLNGPNGLLFGPDNKLYVTTQGSVARGGQADFSDGFPSLVLQYDIATGERSVFGRRPDPSPDSFGFVSFLGLAFGPNDGDLYVSDFANDLVRFDFPSGALEAVLPTNYTGTQPSNNFIGSLAFGAENDLFTVGFDTAKGNVGSVLKFDKATGERTVFIDSSPKLNRPIGILFAPNAKVPEPGAIAALFAATAVGLTTVRRQVRS